MSLARPRSILMFGLVLIEACFVGLSFDSLAMCFVFLLVAAATRAAFLRSEAGAYKTTRSAERVTASVPVDRSIGRGEFRGRFPVAGSPIRPRDAFGGIPLAGQLLLHGGAGLVISAWRLSTYSVVNLNPVAAGIDCLVHATLASLVIVWCRNGWRGHLSMLAMGIVISLLCCAGGGVSRSGVSQLTVGLATGVGFLFAAQQILRRRELTRLADGSASSVAAWEVGDSGLARSSGPGVPPLSRPMLLLLLLVMSGFLTTASVVFNVTGAALPDVQDRVRSTLKDSIESITPELSVGTGRYVEGSTLGGVRRQILGDSKAIALVGKSATAPGYLRGATFEFFSSRSWQPTKQRDRSSGWALRTLGATEPARVVIDGGEEVKLRQRFHLTEQTDDSIVKFEIRNDPTRGRRYFGPLGARWIEGLAQEIRVHRDGVIAGGIALNRPYVWGTTDNPQPERLSFRRRRGYLAVPEPTRRATRRVAESVLNTASTAKEKAEQLEAFFQSKFVYALNFDAGPRIDDPVSRFLETRHPAHCEYFATAAALILRSSGVPTRYVTGYVMDEYDTDRDHWVARNADAHAWVEAYDDESRTWFSVEPTPGRSYQTVSMAAADRTNAIAPSALALTSAGSRDRWWTRLGNWLAMWRGTDTLFLLLRFAQAPLFAVLAGWLFVRYRRANADPDDPREVRSRSLLRAANKLTRRSCGIRRPPGQTLHAFAADLQGIANEPDGRSDEQVQRLGALADWYREFANARFGDPEKHPLPPSASEWIRKRDA